LESPNEKVQTVGPIPICRISKNLAALDLGGEPLESKIGSKTASDPKKPQFEPRYEGLYSKSGEFGPRELAVAAITGYCVYEKKKNREIKNPKQIKLKNGRPAIKGTCASCGKTIFRIGKLK
jgi:Domain of unknown function (DUF5679)